MSYLNTKNQYVIVNQQQIAYRELGKNKSVRPLVLLVHLAATMDNWDPELIDLLAETQHVVMIDLPGVGASQGQVATTIEGMAQQAIAIIQALGFDTINLLGLSMGGMIAQEVVRAEGQLVKRLILVGTGPRAGLGIDRVTATTFRYMLRAALNGVDSKRFIFYNHDEQGKQEADKVLQRLARRSDAYADKKISVSSFLRQLAAIKRWGRAEPDDLRFITQPTLVVNGDRDMMVPTDNSYIMHERIPTSELIIYPNAGHGSLFQYAPRFAADVQAFLEESDA